MMLATGITEETRTGAAAAPDYTTGSPWLCSYLDGNVTEKTPTPDLRDDFYLACNRDGILTLQIQEGYNSAGTQNDVFLSSTDDLKKLFTEGREADSHDAQLAFNLYDLYMDWDGRNAAGAAPLEEEVEAVEAIGSTHALTKYFVETPYEAQLFRLMDIGHTEKFEDSSSYILMVAPAGLMMEDSAEYRERTAYGTVREEEYSALARRMLQKLGYSPEEAEEKIAGCLSFESRIAPYMLTSEEKKKPDYISRINNHYSRAQLEQEQGALPIIDSLEKAMGYPQADDYLVTEPAWLTRLKELYTDENLKALKDFLIVHGVIAKASGLDRECYEWATACANTISGAAGMLPDETAFSKAVAAKLEWPVARLYVEKYLSQKDKDRVQGLIDEVIAAYHGIIEEADFLSGETKAAATRKLDAISKRVLWPDDWSKYSSDKLTIASAKDRGSLWEAEKAIVRYQIEKDVREFKKPVDKEKWIMPPTIFNCFYDPSCNSVTILGAFARGGIYNSKMSDEEMFARIGMVIGHEISHAFDATGAQFDKEGNLNLWWKEGDWAAFGKKNEKMTAYLDAMYPWEGQKFYGSIMTGEACADMGGMKCMLRIAAKKEGFDYDKFFRSYADLWKAKGTLNRTRNHIKDEHPMPYLRVNCILQQYDEFLRLYGIREGDGMYLSPEDRVNIW